MTFKTLVETLGLQLINNDGYSVTFEYATEAEAFVELAKEEGIKVYADFIRDFKTKKYHVYERRY